MDNLAKTLILSENIILQKIKRMAFQVYEENFQEKEIIFAGIQGSGFTLASMIQREFSLITEIPCRLIQVSLDKERPVQSDVHIDTELTSLEERPIILIDDVLNTGRTLSYALKPFLNIRIKKLQTLILVDRKHKSFPISVDFVGYSLSTTIQEHIKVSLNEKDFGVYLS